MVSSTVLNGLRSYAGSVSRQAGSELQRLKPTRIVVAGGAAAVSNAVLSALRGYATTVSRQSHREDVPGCAGGRAGRRA